MVGSDDDEIFCQNTIIEQPLRRYPEKYIDTRHTIVSYVHGVAWPDYHALNNNVCHFF
ncbi:hypothetical protein QR685DRAFT_503239 [Neurospora intermedia]|uniref:Uncharacterized protein n=1 Tax=Neurospora intermedia TaxID=5142 RepID=A0ABR3D5P4_NEUIN